MRKLRPAKSLTQGGPQVWLAQKLTLAAPSCAPLEDSLLPLSLLPLPDMGVARLTMLPEGSRLVRDVRGSERRPGPSWGDWVTCLAVEEDPRPHWEVTGVTPAWRDRGKSLGALRFPNEKEAEEAEGRELQGVPWGVAVFGDCTADCFPS